MSFSLALIHAAHIPERVPAFERLCKQLGLSRQAGLGWVVEYAGEVEDAPVTGIRAITDKAPHWVWSEQAWRFLATSEETHGVVLQDDVTVGPGFWHQLNDAKVRRPNDIIALQCQASIGLPKDIFGNPVPGALSAAERARDAGLRWVSTCDGLLGSGYMMPRELYAELLEWREKVAEPRIVETPGLGEDTLINVWAMATGRLIYHCVPALIDHDTTLASTWGNPHHTRETTPNVTWRDDVPAFYGASGALHAGRHYFGNHWMVLTGQKLPDRAARREALERYYDAAGDKP